MTVYARIIWNRALCALIIPVLFWTAGCGGGGGSAAPPLPENVTVKVFCGRGVQGTDPGVYPQKRNTAFNYAFSLSAGYKDLQVRLAGGVVASSGSPLAAEDISVIATAMPVDELPRFKTNTHTHTTESDGLLTPGQVVSRYHALGYDALFLTDHNKVTQTDSPDGMLVIPGEELTTSAKHANALFATTAIDPGNRQPADFLKEAIDSGALAMLNHPVWFIGWTLQDILPLTGVSLIEIYNASSEMDGFHDNLTLWDGLLSSGRLWYGVASDDAHRSTEIGRGWIMIQAKQLDQASIRQGMEEGSFYASTGVELCRLDLTDGVVHVESRNGETVDFFGNNGVRL